ncbi:hypothetical protein KP509_01G001200 [Ceratopteris richardii]|uniref:Thylakoid lumenal 15 kDa protein 1, chloroplastic n=1 Tax=Ceratopteris richardii TaxID=49495 RepID=A0A8T2VD58_CERRI|nr:hypothetical protein KP509_01G001200 [Ceratopteris richardii]
MASLGHVSTIGLGSAPRPPSRLLLRIQATSEPRNASCFQSSKEDSKSKSVVSFGRAAFLAAAAATLLITDPVLVFTDPALAFKGGGPYGQEVTRGLDLSGRDFSGQTLIKQDFKASILRQTNFKGAKLLGASFFDADLTGSDLTDADLRGADLSLTNAAKANFTNANLEGALVTGNTSFKGATITGADFTDVLFRDDQLSYLCSIANGVNSATGNATRDTLGC